MYFLSVENGISDKVLALSFKVTWSIPCLCNHNSKAPSVGFPTTFGSVPDRSSDAVELTAIPSAISLLASSSLSCCLSRL